MDYRKIDAALASAIANVADANSPELLVFIHTIDVPDESQAAYLTACGVADARNRRIHTAKLSTTAITDLSDQPWVQSIKLSQRLHPLDPD